MYLPTSGILCITYQIVLGFNQKMLVNTRNTTIANRKLELRRNKYYKHINDKSRNIAIVPFSMFLAGGLVVSLYNRKKEIVVFTKKKISAIGKSNTIERLQLYYKITVNRTCDCFIKYSQILMVNINHAIIRLWNQLYTFIIRKELQKPRINMILLQKLQEIGKERKNLGHLLIAAINENKNIRMQYELENMAKSRLVWHIENTHKVIKENRSSYVSFQQLYLLTHQENAFLKSRIQKLTKEKQEAEKNLLEIMNEVYKSNNSKLKAFCSRFIVKTTNNLLTSDVSAEIQKFLDKSSAPEASTSNWQLNEHQTVNSTKSWSSCAQSRFEEIIQDNTLVRRASDAPKLKGLPGEFVWTIKDRDGLIAKLYEYDFTSDLDEGDTIRRIRQYSVYFDKDCLLDSIEYVLKIKYFISLRLTRECVLNAFQFFMF